MALPANGNRSARTAARCGFRDRSLLKVVAALPGVTTTGAQAVPGRSPAP